MHRWVQISTDGRKDGAILENWLRVHRCLSVVICVHRCWSCTSRRRRSWSCLACPPHDTAKRQRAAAVQDASRQSKCDDDETMVWDLEKRGSVLECASPLALSSTARPATSSAQQPQHLCPSVSCWRPRGGGVRARHPAPPQHPCSSVVSFSLSLSRPLAAGIRGGGSRDRAA